MSVPAATPARRRQEGAWTDQDSSDQVAQDRGRASTPKLAAALTTAASERSAPTGASTRWTRVPL